VTTPQPYRRLYRSRDDRVVAGVAAGLAEHLRVQPLMVRVLFIALMVVYGLGAILYVAFWAVLRVKPQLPTDPPPTRRVNALQRFGLVALALGVIILQSQLQIIDIDPAVLVLLVIITLGAGIIWQQSDPQRRLRAKGTPPASTGGDLAPPIRLDEAEAPPDRRWFLVRVIGGGLLMVIGIIGILGFVAPGDQNLTATLTAMAFSLLALAGLVVAMAPVLWRIVGQLGEERVARIREQERAEVAAVVHDQVLHTLALIQRHAADSGSVLRLARGQERSLRAWLYKPAGSPSERLAAALEEVAAEVEDAYGITVETVVVGDAEHDYRVAALVAATREALVNAARHAKVSTVSLYAEVESDALTVFVRDRGSGFNLSDVDDDRHGVRGSIIGRMERHGGTAEIRSAPGEGTEVRLQIRRNGAAPPDRGRAAGATGAATSAAGRRSAPGPQAESLVAGED
jgi:signal transduction histidine kinase